MHIQLNFVIILYQILIILKNSTTFCCLCKLSFNHLNYISENFTCSYCYSRSSFNFYFCVCYFYTSRMRVFRTFGTMGTFIPSYVLNQEDSLLKAKNMIFSYLQLKTAYYIYIFNSHLVSIKKTCIKYMTLQYFKTTNIKQSSIKLSQVR